MTRQSEELKKMTKHLREIKKLSVDARIDLAQAIWNSVREEPIDDDWEFDKQTKRELDRQIADIDAGKSKSHTWEQVKERIRKKMKKKKQFTHS